MNNYANTVISTLRALPGQSLTKKWAWLICARARECLTLDWTYKVLSEYTTRYSITIASCDQRLTSSRAHKFRMSQAMNQHAHPDANGRDPRAAPVVNGRSGPCERPFTFQ